MIEVGLLCQNKNYSLCKRLAFSKKNKTWLEFITSFSSIFCFWGISVILINLVFRARIFDIRGKDLSFKIQLVFILLIVLTLVLFVIGSGIFVRKQYQDLKPGGGGGCIAQKWHSCCSLSSPGFDSRCSRFSSFC